MPTHLSFPYDCYLLAIKSINVNIELTPLENSSLKKAIKYCANHLSNSNIDTATIKRLTIDLINSCEKLQKIVSQDSWKEIIECISKTKAKLVELNYYLAKIYLMSKRYSDFIILKNGILDKYPLKNYLFARYLVTEGKEKEIKGKAGIIELLQSIDFSLNICDVDPDLANEFTAAKTYATYLFQSYKADGTIDISEAAKKALQLFKLQTPTAPQLTDTNLSYSNMFPHLSQLLASNNLLSNDNNNHASSPIPATNPEISSLNNSESETTAISSLDMPYLENSLEHHEHSLIPSGSIPTANKTYHQFKIPAPDKTHVRQQQLEEELKKLRERENQIKEEQLFLQKIKQFDQKGSYDSPQKRAKEDIQKRYSEFFISKQSDEKKNSPSRPNLKLLKNPYTP